jgi:hypothetical protein
MYMSNPKVFISYSHDSEEHKAWVRHLATDLRSNGVDATLDQWDLVLGQDLATFMQKGISAADRVLLVCSEAYVSKADGGTGGVGYERLVVTAEVVQSIDTKKFIPVVRNNSTPLKVPTFLGPRMYIDFGDDANYEQRRDDLLREIHGMPVHQKPPIGENPFSGAVASSAEPSRTTGPTGVTGKGVPVLNEKWFEGERALAEKGIASTQLHGQMELRFALHDGIVKSQIELLSAVRNSGIKTFGWPIGIVIESKDEYKPRPYGDGIRAELSVKDHQSYDYWAVRKNGDFYLLQSLFEDMRAPDQLFFNTRIVRIAESLLFASNLYANLGVPPNAQLSVRVSHRGIAGRKLTSSSPNRMLGLPRVSHEASSEAEIVVTVGKMRESLVSDVRRIAEPLFMLFDFQEFQEVVYTDIVGRFEKGEVT